MRLGFFLLVVATTLLASSSATTAAEPTPMMLKSENIPPSIYAETGANTGNRFLRARETLKEEEDSVKEEEERFADVLKVLGLKNDFASRYLRKMMKNEMFGRWHQNKHSVDDVVARRAKKNPRYQKLATDYKAYEKLGEGLPPTLAH